MWICPRADGHLQATGRDAKGRKQYRYHPDWRAMQEEMKFDRLIAFGEALPAIRQRIAEDLERSGLPREKVVATVVHLLEASLPDRGGRLVLRFREHRSLHRQAD